MSALGGEWEWIVVDDHSRDDTFAVIQQLRPRDARVRGVRLARNSRLARRDHVRRCITWPATPR